MFHYTRSMLKRQKRLLAILFGLTVVFGMDIGQSYARGIIIFGPLETKIEGSINYTLIGKYIVHFNNFKGRIVLDKSSQKVQSVYLEIEVGSIKSNHPWLDKLARSRRLLNAKRYPKIIFKSDKIVQDRDGYEVKGVLDMHGIKRKLAFPFRFKSIINPEANGEWIDLKGSWIINRKDFNIIWNKYLDHGGILVSDNFTVNWGIRTYIK